VRNVWNKIKLQVHKNVVAKEEAEVKNKATPMNSCCSDFCIKNLGQ